MSSNGIVRFQKQAKSQTTSNHSTGTGWVVQGGKYGTQQTKKAQAIFSQSCFFFNKIIHKFIPLQKVNPMITHRGIKYLPSAQQRMFLPINIRT